MAYGEYPGMKLEGGATESRTFSYLIISTSIQTSPLVYRLEIEVTPWVVSRRKGSRSCRFVNGSMRVAAQTRRF